MSWEIFRCNLNTTSDDCSDPTKTMCISEALYKGQADAMAAGGFAAAGYNSIHMDDCACACTEVAGLRRVKAAVLTNVARCSAL